MRDYLSNLVTKTIGTANVIQPRRAARFESVKTKTTFGAEVEMPSQAESLEESHLTEPMPSVPRTRRREVKSSEKDEIISRRNDSDEQIARSLSVTSPKTLATEPGQNDFRHTFTSKPTRATQEKSAIQSLSIPNHTPFASLTLVTPTQSPIKPVENREKSNSLIEHAPLQTPRELTAKTGVPKTSSENFGKQNIEAHTSIVVKPRVEKIENRVTEAMVRQNTFLIPRKPASKRIEEHADEMPETPMINVTIGRVEIRAVMSAAPPKETPAAKSLTLSLDEYLRKRRAGGER